MNSEIVSYLNNAKPDFDSGFALFCRYSRNRIAMDWIGRKHDYAKLIYELGKLAKITEAAPSPTASVDRAIFSHQQQPEPSKRREVPQEVRKIIFRTYDDRRRSVRSELPPDLQEVYDRNAEGYRLRRAYHEKMKMASSQADRAVFRAKTIEADEAIREGYRLIDAYLEKKELEKQQEAPFDEMRCRRYISKILHLEKPSSKQTADCKARVKALLEHGCTITEKTLQALTDKNLMPC